jgi:hypothetical protein
VNTADKITTWRDVRCVCVPINRLQELADLRGRVEVRVTLAGERAWLRWAADSDIMAEVLARRLMPIEGVELFTERGGHWYRLGEQMPAFGVPVEDESSSSALEQIIIPGKLTAERPAKSATKPLLVRVLRDKQQTTRPATAMRCLLHVLVEWAQQATSSQLSPLHGAWRVASPGEQGPAEAIVLGPPQSLPLLHGSIRYWGTDLLIPLGYRTEPDLPEAALRRLIGAGPADLVVLDEDGFELIGREAFRPLTRASVRLAQESSPARDPGHGNGT